MPTATREKAATPEIPGGPSPSPTGRAIYIAEPSNGAAYSDELLSQQVFVLKMELSFHAEQNGNAKIRKQTNKYLIT